MIKNNLKKISKHLKLKHPVTDISNTLGWSKGQVSQYLNDKVEMSANFKEEFAKHYKIDFSDFEDDNRKDDDYLTKNPKYMRDLLKAQERTISSMEKTIATLEDKIRYLEKENFFSTKSLPERNESDEDKKAR